MAGRPEIALSVSSFERPGHLRRCLLSIALQQGVAGKFEVGSTYPERAVNEILKRHHPDYASLRRALVDHGLMQRESGLYWRVVEEKP